MTVLVYDVRARKVLGTDNTFGMSCHMTHGELTELVTDTCVVGNEVNRSKYSASYDIG